MITQEDIEKYIEKIPPAPKVVQQTIRLLQAGELSKAAKTAMQDKALSIYMQKLVNKPIYGFRTEVTDVTQIFTILGIGGSLQAVYSYLMNILSPDEWHFFQMNRQLFWDLQAELTALWNKILKHLHKEDRELETAITLLPSSMIVAEALFREHKKDVELIRMTKDLDLSTILERLSGYTLFDISAMIAKKWEMPQEIVEIVLAASGKPAKVEKRASSAGKWMHLLLFYVLSQPRFIEAGLNDFIEFNVEYVADIYEEFGEIMEIEE